jgi:Leucine-rich repeat (LRR) protein
LSDNAFEGTIPDAVCNLTSLEALFLDENMLNGTIPSCIGNNLENLEQLYLFKNQLTGQVPVELANLTKIGTLS